jgi:S-formylglutathione hydrolase FrmB
MAYFEMVFHSATLNMDVGVNVIIPQKSKGMDAWEKKGNYKLLYLLHGYSDDHTAWQRFTSIERYANEHGIAVVMPEVAHSFYTDMAHGFKYYTYITEELPKVIKFYFPISDKPEDTYIAGLSMGGYGTLKIAFQHPERFAAAGSFSGPLDMAIRMDKYPPDRSAEMVEIFGDLSKFAGSDNDVMALAAKNKKKIGKLPIYQWCGTEDSLYPFNVNFREHAKKLGLNLNYKEGPGDHSWVYWDACIKDFLDWALK